MFQSWTVTHLKQLLFDKKEIASYVYLQLVYHIIFWSQESIAIKMAALEVNDFFFMCSYALQF